MHQPIPWYPYSIAFFMERNPNSPAKPEGSITPATARISFRGAASGGALIQTKPATARLLRNMNG